MKLIRGNRLTEGNKKEVLAAYVHRHLDPRGKTDAEFLGEHAFYITKGGRLSRAHKHCEPACLAETGEMGK